jgi:predicted RNA-binding Zn ribbon-like protein
MPAPEFELIGGHPALDFLNTVHDWTVPDPRDHLADFAAALRFGEAARVLTNAEAGRLARGPARAELGRLRTFRALLARTIGALGSGRTPRPADLAALAAAGCAVAGAVAMRPERGRLRRELRLATAGPALLRLRLVAAALDLLTATGVDRIKACPRCGWFFLDASKNRSRRWCSMATCGASDKASRYYWKSRKRRPRGG